MKKAIYTINRFKNKKIIILFILLTTSLISCTQNGSDNTTVNTEVLILGKWNLISDKYGPINNPTEIITTCQLAFWQFNFVSSDELICRGTSDDPSLNISQCDPRYGEWTYSINNGLLTMTPVNPVQSGNSPEPVWTIKSISSTQLIISTQMNTTVRILTFNKE
jgi:hypothetical protein